LKQSSHFFRDFFQEEALDQVKVKTDSFPKSSSFLKRGCFRIGTFLNDGSKLTSFAEQKVPFKGWELKNPKNKSDAS